MSGERDILQGVADYYSRKLAEHGASFRGVDWNSAESQALRFRELLRVCGPTPFTLLDYGCGYGALLDYLRGVGADCDYRGFDIAEAMVLAARARHAGVPRCAFFADAAALAAADYTVASGIFNVRQAVPDAAWRDYMDATLRRVDALSARGFAFNALTLYSDPERRRPDLYYADPLYWFDFCKKTFSRFVSLIHDYPLYEFTIVVRKQGG